MIAVVISTLFAIFWDAVFLWSANHARTAEPGPILATVVLVVPAIMFSVAAIKTAYIIAGIN